MINSIKELEQLLKLCRKQGVLEIKCHGVEFKLGDLPPKQGETASDAIENTYAEFPTGELTPEQLIYYSSGGSPDQDPFLKKEAS